MRSNEFVSYHTQLFPKAWIGKKMRHRVRYRLLKIADFFIKNLDIPDLLVVDIVLTGSMANYNWTQYSDFDIHVITRFDTIACPDLAGTMFKSKKSLWNDQHNILVFGHEAELYVQDEKETHHSGGVYSLLRDKWITRPAYNPPDVDNAAVNHKVIDLENRINLVLDSDADSEHISNLTARLRKMRQAGLESGGEFSVENLAYKTLRNRGYIDRLYKVANQRQDRALSLGQ
jgi:hypothetical protein